MIERYTLPEIGIIWEDENKYRIWLEIEILACEANAKLGLIPEDAVKEIREKGNFTVERILEIENEVHHDVIAFLTNVAEYVGEPSRFVQLWYDIFGYSRYHAGGSDEAGRRVNSGKIGCRHRCFKTPGTCL